MGDCARDPDIILYAKHQNHLLSIEWKEGGLQLLWYDLVDPVISIIQPWWASTLQSGICGIAGIVDFSGHQYMSCAGDGKWEYL